MNLKNPGSISFFSLEEKDRARIKQAIRLLILLFWGQGGQKDWIDLVRSSQETWKSLERIPGLDQLDIIQFAGDLLREYPHEKLKQELESEFVRIFINTRGGVSAPLYHSCYHDDQNLLMNKPAMEMSRFLENAGMELGPDIGEPPDHLSIELEYLFFLLSQPHAHTDSDLSQHIQVVANEFMLPWIDSFHQKIPAEGVSIFFSHSAAAMKALLGVIGKWEGGKVKK